MNSIEEIKKILENSMVTCTETEYISLSACRHRVLAEDIVAKINVPAFNRSAMDGFCIQTKNPKKAKILGTIYAGDSLEVSAKENSCYQVMTGAMIPEGYDAVIRQEDVCVTDGNILYDKRVCIGENISYCGEDVQSGDVIVKKGTFLQSIHMGILASVGCEKICVFRRMRVSILATGSELLSPGMPMESGKIYCSTMPVIASYVENAGGQIVESKIAGDSLDELKKELSRLAESSDLVITTGGVSVGKKDYLPICMKQLKATMLYDSIAMKPGTPTKGYRLFNSTVLCYSGNPFAALANFEVTFWSICVAFYGSKDFRKISQTAPIQTGFLKASHYTRFVRAKVESGKIYLHHDHQASILSNMVDTNIYVIQPEGQELKEGSVVSYIYAGDICN